MDLQQKQDKHYLRKAGTGGNESPFDMRAVERGGGQVRGVAVRNIRMTDTRRAGPSGAATTRVSNRDHVPRFGDD